MIEYIIIGLLILVIILLIILLVRKNNNIELIDRLNNLEKNTTKDLGDFRFLIDKGIQDDFEKLILSIDKKLDYIDNKVNERLDINLEKTNKTFTNVLERLSKIDEAQKKIDTLGSDIVSLQSVLTDKKTRGIFGEVNLNLILKNIFGEKNDKVYQIQYTLPNSSICDAILFAPEPLGTIAIDSKFPLENFELMTNKNLSKTERAIAEKAFKADVKKHIDAISSKYIIDGVTAKEAIMFLPAEAIFAEINAYHHDILSYAYSKSVWITSPTTLMSTLTIISMIIKDMDRDKYAKVIHNELNKLGIEFGRYRERWDKLSRSLETVNKDVLSIHTTTDKITKRFDEISNVEIKDNLIEHDNK